MTEPDPEMRLSLAQINLRLAKDWTHVAPSVKRARIDECHEELNAALGEMGY